MHTTAIAAMRGYCVYAGTFSASKRKKIETLINTKYYIRAFFLFILIFNISIGVSSQTLKSDSIEIEKLKATRKLYREIRCLTKEIKELTKVDNLNSKDSIERRELKSQVKSLEERIAMLELEEQHKNPIINKEATSNNFLYLLFSLLVFIIGFFIGYLFKKKV